MSDYTITTFDWVPEFARGNVRDLRVRWALEEAGFDYGIQTVPSRAKSSDHKDSQPFGQVPWLTYGEIKIFESGAILLFIGERCESLLPTEPKTRAAVQQWLLAALNSVEMASWPWLMQKLFNKSESGEQQLMEKLLYARIKGMEVVLSERQWLTDSFSIADIAMGDVLRLIDNHDVLTDYPACRAYVARATSRPAFIKSQDDQLAHFATAD